MNPFNRPPREPKHFILRIDSGKHFVLSSPYFTWGINSSSDAGKSFMNNVQNGDILWFVTSKSNGLIFAVATFSYFRERNAHTPSNEDLGWTQTTGEWNMEVHYKQFYDLSSHNLLTLLKGNCPIRKYNYDKCQINLPVEYPNIISRVEMDKPFPHSYFW